VVAETTDGLSGSTDNRSRRVVDRLQRSSQYSVESLRNTRTRCDLGPGHLAAALGESWDQIGAVVHAVGGHDFCKGSTADTERFILALVRPAT
jgi:hypothetical protein